MSIFSPRSSWTTAWTREPFMPTHAPTGSTSRSRERHGDLRAGARLAGRALDADDLLVDLRDLLLEQLLEQALVRARQDDLRAARVAVDVEARTP